MGGEPTGHRLTLVSVLWAVVLIRLCPTQTE